MIRSLRAVSCALILTCTSLGMRASAADAGTDKRFPLGAHGPLQLTVPAGWRDKLDAVSPSIGFSPSRGAPFIITIGPLELAALTREALRQ